MSRGRGEARGRRALSYLLEHVCSVVTLVRVLSAVVSYPQSPSLEGARVWVLTGTHTCNAPSSQGEDTRAPARVGASGVVLSCGAYMYGDNIASSPTHILDQSPLVGPVDLGDDELHKHLLELFARFWISFSVTPGFSWINARSCGCEQPLETWNRGKSAGCAGCSVRNKRHRAREMK